MTSQGSADFAASYEFDNSDTDKTTYAVDIATGTTVTNRFDFASQSDTVYLTRHDWVNTFPTPDGTLSNEESTWGNQVNNTDGKAYVWEKRNIRKR